MIKENEFKTKVAKNLIYYRKANNLTQSDLAQMLNYSDKAISKWERGENLPDLYILTTISSLYGITLNDLISDTPVTPKEVKRKIRLLITFLSVGLVWLIATFVYIMMIIFFPEVSKAWLSFIYAIPISLIVLVVFSSLWWKRLLIISVSLLSWSIPLSIALTFSFERIWFLFICVIPLQVLIILWFRLKANVNKKTDEF